MRRNEWPKEATEYMCYKTTRGYWTACSGLQVLKGIDQLLHLFKLAYRAGKNAKKPRDLTIYFRWNGWQMYFIPGITSTEELLHFPSNPVLSVISNHEFVQFADIFTMDYTICIRLLLFDVRHEKADLKVFVVVIPKDGRAHPYGMTPTFREYDLWS